MISFLKLHTSFRDIFHNPSQKEWALDILDNTSFAKDIVFKWDNSDVPNGIWIRAIRPRKIMFWIRTLCYTFFRGNCFAIKQHVGIWERLTCFAHYCERHHIVTNYGHPAYRTANDPARLSKYLCCNSFETERWQCNYSNYDNYYQKQLYYYNHMYPSKERHKKFRQSYQKVYPRDFLQQDVLAVVESRKKCQEKCQEKCSISSTNLVDLHSCVL